MKENFLSIVIPFYNEENEITDLLNDISLFESKISNLILEYILIDDGSNDKSLKILDTIIQKLPLQIKKKIKVFQNNKNIGWSKTLTRGYSIAKGENVLFIPGDGEARLNEFLTRDLNFDKDIIAFQRKSMPGRPLIRIIISHLYRYFISMIFFTKPMDFNGLIIIKKKKIEELELLSNSFFISAEIIIKSIKKKFTIEKNYSFQLFPKNKYKSTSLNILQIKKVCIDIFRTFIYLLKKNRA